MAFRRPIIISCVKDLKLNYDNPGVQAYFKDLLELLAKRPMGALLIRQEDPDGPDGTYSNQLDTDCITLNANDAFYNEKTKYLTLTENGVLTLLHEGSHFQHLCISKGKYISPAFRKCDPMDVKNVAAYDALNSQTGKVNRYMIEFEAGYRAVCTAIMYDTNLEDKVIGDNLRNLLAITNSTPPEINMLTQLLSKPDINYAFYNLIGDVTLSLCAEASKDHAFNDFADVEKFKFELTPKQKVLIMLVYKLINDYMSKSDDDKED